MLFTYIAAIIIATCIATMKDCREVCRELKFFVIKLAWMVAVMTCEVPSSGAMNPGFRTILTTRGLNYGMNYTLFST